MLNFLTSALSYVAPFLFVLGLVVTVHEYGHFLAARLCGVAVDRFSIGFGKALISWRGRSGVEYRIGWIPLGGYVKFAGDENAASVPDSEDLEAMRRRIEATEGPAAVARYFHFKPIWQRAVITASGPLANFVLSSVLFAVLLGAFGQAVTTPRIAEVRPGGAAQQAGFLAGDLIRKVNGHRIDEFSDFAPIVALSPGKTLVVDVERAGRDVRIFAIPRAEPAPRDPNTKIGALGLSFNEVTHRRYQPLQAVVAGPVETGKTLRTTVYFLGQMITGKVSPDNISGVIGIAQASGTVAKAGAQDAPDMQSAVFGSFVALLGLAAFMSVSIGFMNLLPVPVLDGGHLLFYAYEALARRPLGAKVQAAGYRVGLAMVLGLMLFATWNDLQRLQVFSVLGRLFS